MTFLVGDIGGTNTRLALADANGVQIDSVMRASNDDYDSFDAVLATTAGDINVTALATPAEKAPALVEFATQKGLPLIPVSPEDMQAAETVTQSGRSLVEKNTGSVAEACALAAAGANARLLVTRQISTDRLVTCAIAQGDG